MSKAYASPWGRSRALDRLSTVLFVLMHLSLLFVFVVPFKWSLVAMCLGGYVVRMWAVTAGYHRYFAHRSFKTSRAMQLFLAVLGTTSMQNGPIWWASVHRRHHKFSDLPADPHSPSQKGFWYSHLGWIFDKGQGQPDYSNVKDLTRWPELRFIDGHSWIALIAYAVGCFVVAGLPGLVWGFVVSTMMVMHATMLINSLAHVWGTRRYATGDDSRNNGLLALATLGEGWHNNHHHFMSAARQGFMWWEIDVTYYTLRALGWLGAVWGIREPTAQVLAGPLEVIARGRPAVAAAE